MKETLFDFRAELRREDRAENTVASYLRDLEHFARWFEQTNGEDFNLGAVTPLDVKDYRRFLLVNRRARPATVNRRLAALRKLFRWACGKRLADDEPTEQVKGVGEGRRLAPRALDRIRLHALLRAVQLHGGTRDIAIVQLLRHTGVRVSELTSLRMGDVSISDRRGSITVRWGEGGKYRQIDLNSDARRAVEDYLQVRPATRDGHLFIGQRGVGLTPMAVEGIVSKYAGWAGLQSITPHTLRHTFAKDLLDSGEDLVTVATLTGRAFGLAPTTFSVSNIDFAPALH